MGKTSKNKIFSAYFFLTVLAFFLINMGVEALYSTFSLYVDGIGGSAARTGVLTAAFGAACIAARVFSGVLADRRGRWVTLLGGCALFGGAIFACGFVQDFWLLLALRLLQAAGYSAATTATASSVAACVSRERLGEAVGYYGLGQSVATAAAPSVALAVAAASGFRRMYMGFGLLTAAALVFALASRPGERKMAPQTDQQTPAPREKGLFLLLERTALPAAAVNFFVSFSLASVICFVTLFAAQRGIGESGLFYTIAAAAMLLAKLVAGRLSDRLGALRVITPAFVLSIGFFAALALTENTAVFLVCAGIYGFCNGLFIPVLNAAALHNTPPCRVGAASGTFYCGLDAGVGLGSVLWGLVIDALGFTAMYFGAACCMLIALVLSLTLLRRKK